MKLTIRITIGPLFPTWRARRAERRMQAQHEDVYFSYLEKLPVDRALAELAARNKERTDAGLKPYKWQPMDV